MMQQVPIEAGSSKHTGNETVAKKPVDGPMSGHGVVHVGISLSTPVLEQLSKRREKRKEGKDSHNPRDRSAPLMEPQQ